MEQHTILKYVCTRWLSLERALDSLLEQWEPLVEYFRKESEVQSAGGKRKNDDQKQGELKKMKTASTSEVQPKKRTGVPVIAQASKSISTHPLNHPAHLHWHQRHYQQAHRVIQPKGLQRLDCQLLASLVSLLQAAKRLLLHHLQ